MFYINKMTTKIFGICLESRQKAFCEHIHSRGIIAEIVPAVTTAQDKRISCFGQYDENHKNNLATLSHLVALQSISLSECEYGIVFEDDVHLHINFNDMLQSLITSSCVKKHELVALGYLFAQTASKEVIYQPTLEAIYNVVSIGKNAWTAYGLQGYICTKEYAGRVVEAAKLQMFGNPEGAVLSCCIKENAGSCSPNTRIITFPPLCIERFDKFGSTLDHTQYNHQAYKHVSSILQWYQ